MTTDHLALIREIHAKYAPGSPAHCSILILIGHLLACLGEDSRPAATAAVKELVAAHQEFGRFAGSGTEPAPPTNQDGDHPHAKPL